VKPRTSKRPGRWLAVLLLLTLPNGGPGSSRLEAAVGGDAVEIDYAPETVRGSALDRLSAVIPRPTIPFLSPSVLGTPLPEPAEIRPDSSYGRGPAPHDRVASPGAPGNNTRDFMAPGLFMQQGQITEAIVRIRLGQAVDQVMLALARDSTVLIPLGQFTDIAEVLVERVNQDTLFQGRVGRRQLEFVVDTRNGIIRVGDDSYVLAPDEAVWRDQDLFVDIKHLATIFGFSAQMDWTELQLRIWDAGNLPVVARHERAQRRRFYEEIGLLDDATPLPTASPPIDGAVLDWAASAPTRSPIESSILQFGAGGQVAGGSLDLRYMRFNVPAGFGTSRDDFAWSWVKAWPESNKIRQFRAGDVSSTGRRPTVIQGASITNAPFVRPVAFAEEMLAGEFPEGWEVEVYRGSRLVGFTVVGESGEYGIRLPVQYGTNPVTLIGYGPRGEVVEIQRTFEIPFQRLPGGQFEYAVSGGECGTTLCRGTNNVDLRYGVTDRLTLQTGSDAFWTDSSGSFWHPYALASLAVTRSLSLTAEGVLEGLGRGRLDYTPTPDLRLGVSHTIFDTSNPSPFVSSLFELNRTEVTGFWRPGFLSRRMFFEARGFRSSQGGSIQRQFGRVSSTLRWSGARVTSGVFVDRLMSPAGENSRTGWESSFNKLLSGPGAALRNVFFQAGSRVDSDYGFSQFKLGLGRQVMAPLRLDVEGIWDEVTGTNFNVSLTSVLRQVRAVSRNQYTSRSGLVGTQTAEGSLLWNRPGARAELGNGRALGRSGVTGVVFFDENGNGTQERDEPPVEGITVRVGSNVLTSDSLGQFSTWDLVPFEKSLVEIDSMSIENPLWIPMYGKAYINPIPNAFQTVALPLLQGGEVNGQVLFADNGRPLTGASVLLIHQETGDTTRVMTFSDGSFYAYGLRGGTYLADLAPGLLLRLDGIVAPASFSLRPTEGILFANDVMLMVVRDR
jgi:hypothetical protein